MNTRISRHAQFIGKAEIEIRAKLRTLTIFLNIFTGQVYHFQDKELARTCRISCRPLYKELSFSRTQNKEKEEKVLSPYAPMQDHSADMEAEFNGKCFRKKEGPLLSYKNIHGGS